MQNKLKVLIKIYELLDIEVETIINIEKPTGKYETEFNTETLPSEVYFYRLQVGSLVEMKKMLLVK